MTFEFDPKKSQANKAKHGIDFVAGQSVWSDPEAIRDVPAAVKEGESYWKAVGMAEGRLWAAIYCYRGENRNIRIVSIRAARDDEKEQYDLAKS